MTRASNWEGGAIRPSFGPMDTDCAYAVELDRELRGQNDPRWVRSWMDTWYATSEAMAEEVERE